MATTSPWTLDAKDFLGQVQPLMAKSAFTDYEKLVGGRYSGGEGGDYTPYSDAASNRWSQQDSTPQDVTLTLADGRKWTPSGHGNGIVFHPKGEVTQGGWKGGENGGYEQIVNPEGYYEVSGDASKLLGKDNAGQSVTVRYKQVGDKMVPMEDAQYQGYSKGVWNNGLKQFAMLGAMAVGGWALAPGAGAGTAATAASASGAAGMMGMNAGLGATAVNTGLASAGVSKLQGNSWEDAIKTGFVSGALSGVGGWASETIGGATAGLGATTSKALSTIGSGAITGGAGAVLTGQDVGEGIKGGIISSGIRAIGNVASKEVKDLVGTDNPVAGRIAGGVVNSTITGSSPLGILVGEVTTKVGGFDTLSKEQQATVNSVVASAIKGKKLTPKQIIDLAAATVKDVKQALEIDMTEYFNPSTGEMVQIDDNETEVDDNENYLGNGDKQALHNDTSYTGGSDAEIEKIIQEARASGVNTTFLDQIGSAWKGASSFAKDNKEILGMFGSGISNGMKDKSASERQDKQNQYLTATAAQKRTWDLEDAARKKADEKELWDRRNQSIIDMKPVDMGIIGKNMYDSQLAYMQSRKK